MYEALQRLRLEAFMDYVGKDREMSSFVDNLAESFLEDKSLTCEIESPEMQQFNSYEAFITELSSKLRTFDFWSMYIKMAGKSIFSGNLSQCTSIPSNF
jgi:hypothetical protein